MAACRSVFCWGRLVCTVPKAIVLGMRHGVREASKVEVEVEVSVLGRQCMRRAGPQTPCTKPKPNGVVATCVRLGRGTGMSRLVSV